MTYRRSCRAASTCQSGFGQDGRAGGKLWPVSITSIDLPPYGLRDKRASGITFKATQIGQKIQAVCGKLGAPYGSEGSQLWWARQRQAGWIAAETAGILSCLGAFCLS